MLKVSLTFSKYLLCLTCITLTCLTSYLTTTVFAETEFVPQSNDIPLINDEYEAKLDATQKEASAYLASAANWLDSFFDDERSVAEENQTRAKVRLGFGYTKNDHFEFTPRVSLRLKVPNLSKKVLLSISISDDDDFDADQNPISDNPRFEDSERSDLSASLKYFLKAKENYNLSTMFGGSYNYLYAGLRYRYSHDFGPWQGRFTDTVKYYTDDGWENKASIDMERHFSRKWFFRTTANAYWFEEEDGVPHSLHFQLYQVLNEESALMYEVGNYFDTEPEYRMTDLHLRVRYRQRFYRDWLIFEIAPQLTFPEDHDRDPNPGILLRFEADFGYLSDQNVFEKIFKF